MRSSYVVTAKVIRVIHEESFLVEADDYDKARAEAYRRLGSHCSFTDGEQLTTNVRKVRERS